MVDDDPDLIGRGGWALAAGGVLFVVATVLHPSQETPASILAMEARLVGSHAVNVVASLLLLLGLPVLYSAELRRVGRLGSVGFLGAWPGTALLTISSQFGFIAPHWPRRPRQPWTPSSCIRPWWRSTQLPQSPSCADSERWALRSASRAPFPAGRASLSRWGDLCT